VPAPTITTSVGEMPDIPPKIEPTPLCVLVRYSAAIRMAAPPEI